MKLNAQQQEAVRYLATPLRIVAGAGSGKTRVLTHKIKYLIEHDFPPERIAAITFTNKATNEMQERLAMLTSPAQSARVLISTYHALCVRILRSDLNMPPFSQSFHICDREDQKILVKKFVRELKLGHAHDPKEDTSQKQIQLCLRFIEKCKKRGLYPGEEPFRLAKAKFDPADAAVYQAYQTYLQHNNHLDFNDLINYTYRTLKLNTTVRVKWQNKFDYVLVDEFQDTDQVQLEIIQMLAQRHITVVGDPNQMIYAWRGAKGKIFHNFSQLFPHGRTIFLNRNYRSTPEILDLANDFIQQNNHHQNELVANKPQSGRLPLIVEFEDRYGEAQWIANKIKKLTASGYQARNIIILMRANYLSRAIEDVLREHRIRYKLMHDFPFWRRVEIKDCLAVLDVLLVGNNAVAWERVLQTIKGIGTVNTEKLQALVRTHKLSWAQLFTPEYESQVGKGLVKLLQPIYRLLTINLAGELVLWQLAQQAFRALDWLPPATGVRTEIETLNMQELIDVIREQTAEDTKRDVTGWKTWFVAFIDRIRISQEEKENDAELRNAVRIMTVHKAKGLESKIVFIMSVNENVLPSGRSTDIQEERRIFYVAMTRAQERLHISYHLGKRYARTAGGRSSFIADLNQRCYRFYAHQRPPLQYDPPHASESVPPAPSNASLYFRHGASVQHPFYGRGVVVKQKANNLIVDFDRQGVQTIKVHEVQTCS